MDNAIVGDNSTSHASSDDTLSDEEDEDPESLRDMLYADLVKSKFDKTPHKFAPEGIVDKLITEEAVRDYLRITRPEEQALIDFILLRAKKAFATMVMVSYTPEKVMKAIKWLENHGRDDENFPIVRQSEWKKSWFQGEFQEEHWKFFVPTFSTTKYNHDLEEAHILPFISETTDGGEGSFGVVTRYTIHRKHIIPAVSDYESFAVKEIKPGKLEDAQGVAEHWEKEVKALRMMNNLNQEHIVHFVTAFRRRKASGGAEHYLMFEWADGGNLRNLWNSMSSPPLTASLVKDTLKQILGLAKALEAAHNLNKTGASYRHGDLKPENILVFRGNGSIGTLKIGDWGEAKSHEEVTQMRPRNTTARFGTRRYEAPEVEIGIRATYLGQPTKRRSRLYDIWAMGCITLEFVIWLLYGMRGLNRFNSDLGEESFYQIGIVNGNKVAEVNSTAVRWMDFMAIDLRCQVGTTAIGDLLELVRTALLVVRLPRRLGTDLPALPESSGIGLPVPTERSRQDSALSLPNLVRDAEETRNELPTLKVSDDVTAASNPLISFTPAEPEPVKEPVQPEPEPEGTERCLASGFRGRVEHIVEEDESDDYWHTYDPEHPVPANQDPLPSLHQMAVHSKTERQSTTTNKNQGPTVGLAVPTQKRIDYAPPELDENDWKFQFDNEFASNLCSSLQTTDALKLSGVPMALHLCDNCNTFRTQIWGPFRIEYDVSTLRDNALARQCSLCILLWQTVLRSGGTKATTVTFDRTGPFLRIKSDGPPVLSVVCTPEQDVLLANEFQLGFAGLPEAGNATHVGVIQYWLNHCNSNHSCRPLNDSTVCLPTRLIDVGKSSDDTVRLRVTAPTDTGDWIALSHKWGDKHFSTTPDNLQAHLKSIELSKLPATFRDAVTVTRALGLRYLWIDSLCVIQGAGGDFRKEAKRMEEVYSGAYCVIAASCAADHYSGFLKPRNARDCIGMRREGKDQTPFYICQTIDNFKEHVLDGELHSRGWVMQEHALARRTLFFTEHQTYFECKDGVRCETSTKMKNNLAAFLGDPNFPHILSDATQGAKIRRYQRLYREYSRLGLSKPFDRPTAIDGLQQRLLRTMRVNGGYGVFDEGLTRGLLRRSLLWRRGNDTFSLSRIHFPPESVVPYVPSWSWMAYTGGIDYLEPEFSSYEWEDLVSPWSAYRAPKVSTDPQTANIALVATAREYDLGVAVPGEGELIFDTPGGSSQLNTLCVVLGKAKESLNPETQRHYILIVAATVKQDRTESKLYERVGAGYLPGKCISPSCCSITIH